MRCGCFECGAYMIQAESSALGCVCPQCGYRCRACMGTNTMMDRDAVRSLKKAHDAVERSSTSGEAAIAEHEGRMALVEAQLRMMEREQEMNGEKPHQEP